MSAAHRKERGRARGTARPTPIEVVHAFGSCPGDIRDNICMLDNQQAAYAVGSRIAVTEAIDTASCADRSDARGAPGQGRTRFLSTGLRVSRVTALNCSRDKRFVAVCFKAVDEPLTAYATVYHVASREHYPRVKTISYRRPNRMRANTDADASSLRGPTARTDQGNRDYNRSAAAAAAAIGAQFATVDFSHDGELLVVLDDDPGRTLLWFEWKSGKRLFTLELDELVRRVAFSVVDSRKLATAGDAGQLRIWSTQAGKVSPMVPIVGLREDVSYRDVAWLNGDRLVAAAQEGFVTLVSPANVLHEWDVRAGLDDERCDVSRALARETTDNLEASEATPDRPKDCCERINVVASHERGFLVGGQGGRVLVFEPDENAGGSARDAYMLSRVVHLFEMDVVELRPGKDASYRWLLAGAGDGEVGVLDTNELFSTTNGYDASSVRTAPAEDRSSCQSQQVESARAGASTACRSSRSSRKFSHGTHAMTGASGVNEGEAIIHGFSKAMDDFEAALKATTADENASSRGEMSRRPKTESGAVSVSTSSGVSATQTKLYRTVVRDLVAAGRQRSRGRGYLSCLTTCARKPLIAGIARFKSRASGHEDMGRDVVADPFAAVDEHYKISEQNEPTTANGRQSRVQLGLGVQIQVWNYRTKEVLLQHQFGDTSFDNSTSGGDDTPPVPVAISLHPSGDFMAVAFEHYVNTFYIVGSSGNNREEAFGRELGTMASTAGLSEASSTRAAATPAAATERPPVAMLRSDQREFVTKGIFAIPGEQDPIINHDAVSAVHYSPGGHLLAVVTGKVVQVLGVHAGGAGGRLGRVQTLSGHAADVSSFCWGADDRRCWTAADGYLFEWEVGAGMGRLGLEGFRRGEFVSKSAMFDGIVADPALDGGVAACCVFNAPRVKDAKSKRLVISSAPALTPAVRGAAASGRRIASGAGDDNEAAGRPTRTAAEAHADTFPEAERSVAAGDKTKLSENPGDQASSVGATAGGSSLSDGRKHPRGGRGEGYGGLLPAAENTHQGNSSLFVWPSKLDVPAESGLQVRVPYRLTCVRATAFEARLTGARNVLLAGTSAGIALAFDWGCLLRASQGHGRPAQGGSRTAIAAPERTETVTRPSAQVCLHSQPITSLALTADGKHFFTAALDGALFMCNIQLEGRCLPATGVTGAAPTSPAHAGGSGGVCGKDVALGLVAADLGTPGRGKGGCTFDTEACVEEGMLLMEQETVGRLQARALSAARQLEQLRHQARFELEKERLAHGKRLEAAKAIGQQELSRVQVDINRLQQALSDSERAQERLIKSSADQQKREASIIHANYEKKLALQAESYIQLKVAYEELSQAARDDAEEMQAMAEDAERAHEIAKREDMKKVLDDNDVLRGYVEFVGAQYHKAIDDEQQLHDKQVNVLRATEEVAEIEKARVREEAKAEVIAAKKEARTLSKRMEQQCTREVDAVMDLAAQKEKVEHLEARVAFLEQEVRAKAQRLSEWENMIDKQKTAVTDLEQLKKALTMQLVEQRSQLEEKDELLSAMQQKLAKQAKVQGEGVRQIGVLQKEAAGKGRLFAALKTETERLRTSLAHREGLLKAAGTRVMSVLDAAHEKDLWIATKEQVEAIMLPLLERDGLDRVDPDEVAVEQARQRTRMQENIHKLREALRHEQQNSEQQNLVRVNENLELTRELHLARKRSTELEAEVVRLEATIKFDRARRKQARSIGLHVRSAPNMPNKTTTFETTRSGRASLVPPGQCDSASLGHAGGKVRKSCQVVAFDSAAPPESATATLNASRRPNSRTSASNTAAVTVCDSAGDRAATAVGGLDRTEWSRGSLRSSLGSRAVVLPSTLSNPVDESAPSSSSLAPASGGGLGKVSNERRTCYDGSIIAPCDAAHRTRALRRKSAMHGMAQGGRGQAKTAMRVLLPGEGARDYASLLRGTGSLRARQLEARVATAEAEVSRLSYEKHRVAVDAKQEVAATEAEAVRVVGALTAELERLRQGAGAAVSLSNEERHLDTTRETNRGNVGCVSQGWGPASTARRRKELGAPLSTVPHAASAVRGADGVLPPGKRTRAEASSEGDTVETTTITLRLPSPQNTTCQSDAVSLSAPTPFSEDGSTSQDSGVPHELLSCS